MSFRREIGNRGEEIAAEHFINLGYTIVGRNVHVSHDEIDIIAEDDVSIVFIEVKTRSQTKANKRYGRPAMAIDFQKKQHLIRAAEEYLRQTGIKKRPRIDVVEVYFPGIHEDTPIDISKLRAIKLNHIRNAVHK